MPRGPSRNLRAIGGMTLLEVLVALAIASIVFATVFLLFRTTAATAVRQRDREQTTYAPAGLLAALQSDVAALIPDGLDENCALKLQDTKGNAEASELSLCIWSAGGSAGNGAWSDAERISWRMEGGGTPDARIARTSSVLTGPRSAITLTNYFLRGIARFRISLHDGNGWLAAWPPPGASEEKKIRPISIRIDLALQGGGGTPGWTTDFIVPTGLRITSRVERVFSPAARATEGR